MSGRPPRVAGPLHNLVLQIEHDEGNAASSSSSSFHLFSTEKIELVGPARSAQGRDVVSAGGTMPLSPSKRLRQTTSLTPSPQKSMRARQAPKLVQWTLRLCQQVKEDIQASNDDATSSYRPTSSAKRNEDGSSSSETESEPSRDSPTEERLDAKGKAKENLAREMHSASPETSRAPVAQRVTRSAWYSATIDGERADELFGKQIEPSSSSASKQGSPSSSLWPEVEARIKKAWEDGAIDVAVSSKASSAAADGTYSSLCIVFGGAAGKEANMKQEAHSDNSTRPLAVTLERVSSSQELNEATTASIELMQALGVLATRTQQLTAERNERRILYEGGHKKKVKEASLSTANVGRIRRKLVDDEGFEGEDE